MCYCCICDTLLSSRRPGFYLTFWQLSTYDISPPLAKYEEETANLRALSRQEDSKYISADRSSDRMKRLSAGQHRNKRDRYNTFANLLTQESKDQVIAIGYTKKRMVKERSLWFAHSKRHRHSCWFWYRSFGRSKRGCHPCHGPRGTLFPPSSVDFSYGRGLLLPDHQSHALVRHAGILYLEHVWQGLAHFLVRCGEILTILQLLSEHIKAVIFTCTEYEARNYGNCQFFHNTDTVLIQVLGRFLSAILTDLYKWHQDEQLFLSDNRTKGAKVSLLPGFMLRFSNKNVVTTEDIIKWPEFRVVLKKWHRKLLKVRSMELHNPTKLIVFLVCHRWGWDRRIYACV